jgi:hypothetical protein
MQLFSKREEEMFTLYLKDIIFIKDIIFHTMYNNNIDTR